MRHGFSRSYSIVIKHLNSANLNFYLSVNNVSALPAVTFMYREKLKYFASNILTSAIRAMISTTVIHFINNLCSFTLRNRVEGCDNFGPCRKLVSVYLVATLRKWESFRLYVLFAS